MSRIAKKTKPLALLVLTLGLVVATGCESGKKSSDVYSTNIRKLHLGYTMFMETHAYVGPKDEAELKDFMKNNPTAVHLLKRIDITPDIVDDIFVSDRDGQPFVVRYGLRGEADHAIVFEAEGVDGKRLVALSGPKECETDEYDGYLSGKIKPDTPPSAGGMTDDADEAAQRADEIE